MTGATDGSSSDMPGGRSTSAATRQSRPGAAAAGSDAAGDDNGDGGGIAGGVCEREADGVQAPATITPATTTSRTTRHERDARADPRLKARSLPRAHGG